MSPRPQYPFSALHGQPQLQLALLLAAIDPHIGGVLIEGPRGTAKSTSARALAELLPGQRFVDLPLGASEEQLVGSLDIQAALQNAEVAFKPGLLARADGGVLYVDEVNLLADALVDLLLDVCASGVNRIERDGISHQHEARIALVGTMNPEEGELRPQLLDRFGLFVRLGAQIDPASREAIVRSRLAFDRDPHGFVERQRHAQQALIGRLEQARACVGRLDFSDALHRQVSSLCHAAGVEGVRADLVMLRAAAAHAAWLGQEQISDGDIEAVAELVLAHRRKTPPAQSEASAQQVQQQGRQQPAPDSADNWGALPPQAVATQALSGARPLPKKKP
ncbi:ATP-binding protein [Stutzerimonas nitrititolerans]|uniref:Magnesium chelatase n=1 Tax=Stutzerimonas nitrititolerans TaxID=2482751 RepID=A0ABX9UT26_9GAMM|nr:AAA family ATPase [Stutzerimonas nitrititolerans]RMH96464.1 magnesium chelatase [Stutzerimonas nitrititolerans]